MSRVLIWPVEPTSVGESVLAIRGHKPQPHHGIDLHCPAGTLVVSACDARVTLVIDGRKSKDPKRKAAGLWIDCVSRNRCYRYLHLGTTHVWEGESVTAGQPLGTVAEAFTSGLAERPHLHFEIREWTKAGYGESLDPLRYLPKRIS